MTDNIYEFMHSLQVEGQAETIDALTITATNLEGKLSISLVIEAMRDYLILQEKKPFKFRKAIGWTRGSVSYAEELKEGIKLWSILMVKGEQSEIAFTEACKLKDLKVTRIDVAVDVLLLEKVTQLPRKLKDTYKGKYDISLIESATGDTIYCGSRESGIFIRIYDKSEEYNLDLGFVWRFEVEFKKGTATTVFELLRDNGIAVGQDVVWTAVRGRDLPTPKIGQTVNLKARKVTFSTPDMKLAWLGRQVRPTVQYLMNIGKVKEVYKQLGFELDETQESR
jgi:hypothetical protein